MTSLATSETFFSAAPLPSIVMEMLTGEPKASDSAAQISSDDYHRIYFNISEFSSAVKKVERVSVWVRPHGEKETGEYSLVLNGISVFHKTVDTEGGGALIPALITAGAVVLLIAAAYMIIVIRSRKQYKRTAPEDNGDGSI